MVSGEWGFTFPGLKFKGGEEVIDTEFEGEAEFEQG